MRRIACVVLLMVGVATGAAADADLLHPENLKTMGCAAPDTKYMFVRSSRPDGALEFYDIAGNREFEGQEQITLPLDYLSRYIRSPRGGAKLIAQRLKAARMVGVRPVEIIARDLAAPVDAPGAAVVVTLHNLLNRAVKGTLTVTPPEGISLGQNAVAADLDAGQSVDVNVKIARAEASPANAYLFAFRFDSDAGEAEWREALHVVVAKKATKMIDGDLGDWQGDIGVIVNAEHEKADLTERAWLPFVEARETDPDGTFGEVRLAWDDTYLYVAAQVNDPTEYEGHQRLLTWDEDQFFRSAKDDAVCESLRPFEKFVFANLRNTEVAEKMKADPLWPAFQTYINENPEAKHAVTSNAARVYFEAKRRDPDATFADATNVYKKVPWNDTPWSGDTLQLGFDFIHGYYYRMKPDTDRVAYGFHSMPDTDHEYAAYACGDGGSELWRILAPGVPRGHYGPRQKRATFDQGVVPGGLHVVRRAGTVTTYELAIPWTELKDAKPQPGGTFGFTFRVNNNKGPGLPFGANKSATKTNGLSLHPYWLGKPSCTIRWTFLD